MRTSRCLGLSGILATAALASPITVSQVKLPVIENGTSPAQFTYPGYGIDGPRVDNVNSTVFDWWYFDAFSENVADGDLSSIVAVFYDGTTGGFQALPESQNKIQMSFVGSFANGTSFRAYTLPAQAVISSDATGSSGDWGGYGGWSGDVETGDWELTFESEELGVTASVRMEQRAPPHFSCSLVEHGASEVIVPHVGWINTVPDARATVEFEVNGTAHSFTGVGYHDKNWADRPFFNESVTSWYWGHAYMEPYSIVWFDALDHEGTEYFSTYVARDGDFLASNCNNGTVIVRPWGGEDTYPPPAGTDTPAGFILTFADVECREFVVNVTTAATPVPLPLYNRFIGVAEGRFACEDEVFTGSASYEQFKAA